MGWIFEAGCDIIQKTMGRSRENGSRSEKGE